jgi:hypothetical protein
VDCSQGVEASRPSPGMQSRTVECLGECVKDEAETLFRTCIDTPCFERACAGDPCGKDNSCSTINDQGQVRLQLPCAVHAHVKVACGKRTQCMELHEDYMHVTALVL